MDFFYSWLIYKSKFFIYEALKDHETKSCRSYNLQTHPTYITHCQSQVNSGVYDERQDENEQKENKDIKVCSHWNS